MVGLLWLIMGCALAGDQPDSRLTPGVANPQLTQQVICAKGFRTTKYREVDDDTKNKVCALYHLPAHCDAKEAYEIDHLIDIDNGGSNDIKNLWPQKCSGPNNCHDKDKLEVRLHKLVCAGKVGFAEAQHEIATDWLATYQKYVGKKIK